LPSNVASANNGISHPQNDTIVAEYNEFSQLIKSTDARGVVTEYEYDESTGTRTQVIRDSGSGKLNLTEDYTVNVRGRVTKTLGPAHDVDGVGIRTTNWSIKVSEHETWSAAGYHVLSSGAETLVNPVSIEKRSADGTTHDRITAKRGSSVESSGALSDSDSFPQSSWVAWTRQTYDVCGRMLSSRVYHNIPSSGEGSVGTNYIETSYDHDEMSRQNKTVSPDGTINRMVYNSRGMVESTWVGTNDTGATDSDPTGSGASGNNMVKLSVAEYDNGSEGGNGLKTKVTQLVNSTAADNRVTEMEYDWRNRLENTITTDGTFEFHQKPTLDNLGRATVNQMYRDDSGTLKLIAKSESFFDERGRSYRSKTYAVGGAGVAGNALESNQWFNENGQVIKSSSPGSTAFTKTVYDAVGRATETYSAYYDGVGTDDPESITSNVVLTESITEFNDVGQVVLSTSKDRLHDATGNGSLNGPSGSQPKSRDSYAAMWYDEIGRSVASANYGTNAGTAPTRPNSAPASSDTVLVSQSEFDITGRAIKSTDPAGAVVKNEFDDAGRTTKVIHNFGGTDTQTIRTEFNSVGQMSKQIAENADTGNQETVYTYGVTTASGSDLASNQLLEKVTHPDTGTVTYDYDRTGQQISMTDANGSVHDYSYDEAGRRIADVVATLGSGVDGSVRRIEHGYDSRMRLETITSYDATTAGSVESEIQYAYNDFGQMTKGYQQHGAAVNVSNSPVVEYDYAGGSSNTIRMTGLTYPDGRELEYDYGTSGSVTDLLDRVATIKDSGIGFQPVVTYTHTGSGSV
jgi:YD repeat-containing protein